MSDTSETKESVWADITITFIICAAIVASIAVMAGCNKYLASHDKKVDPMTFEVVPRTNK